jgi:heterotetrameric sarcosine oxidase gamma subunit
MASLATIPYVRSLPTQWDVAADTELQIAERSLKAAVLIKAGRRSLVAAALGDHGFTMPAANRWELNGEARWLWQGPHECLITSDTLVAAELARDIESLLARMTVAVIDVTDRTLQLDIHGANAPRLFAKGTSLDPALLSVGACCRTRFAGLPVSVLCSTVDGFSLIADRSFTVYLHAWLTRAAQDLAPQVAR